MEERSAHGHMVRRLGSPDTHDPSRALAAGATMCDCRQLDTYQPPLPTMRDQCLARTVQSGALPGSADQPFPGEALVNLMGYRQEALCLCTLCRYSSPPMTHRCSFDNELCARGVRAVVGPNEVRVVQILKVRICGRQRTGSRRRCCAVVCQPAAVLPAPAFATHVSSADRPSTVPQIS